jgi:hypothetical protein
VAGTGVIFLVVGDVLLALIGVQVYGTFFVATAAILTPVVAGGWWLVQGGSPLGRTVRRASDSWQARRGGRPHEAWDE